MPKERAPISTRLRNRDKNDIRILFSKDTSKGKDNKIIKQDEAISLAHNQLESEENIPFSPRADPNIYIDELQSPLSFVRGSEEERNQFLKNEDSLTSQSFRGDYKSFLQTSTFYQARVSSPVPSKRSRHLEIQTKPSSLFTYLQPTKKSSSSESESPDLPSAKKRKKTSPSILLSPSLSSSSSTPTPGILKTPSFTPSLSATPIAKSTKAYANGSNAPKNTISVSLFKTAKKPIITKPKSTQSSMLAAKTASLSSSPVGKKEKNSIAEKVSNKKMTSVANEHSQFQATPAGSGTTALDDDRSTIVPLPLCKKLPVTIKMDPKDKEKEYWRRQRRAFVHSRFLTNEECVQLAKTVYSNLFIDPEHRTVTSFQGNIANFRTKLRKTFNSHTKNFHLSRDYVTNTNKKKLHDDLAAKMNIKALKSIWEHWIADPFVDSSLFYAGSNKKSVDILRYVTVQLMIIHFKERYHIYTPKKARSKMRELDSISRGIVLPDTSQHS